MIGGRCSQVFKVRGPVEHIQLAQQPGLELRRHPLMPTGMPKFLQPRLGEGLYHTPNVSLIVTRYKIFLAASLRIRNNH